MSSANLEKRMHAVRLADAINAIGGVPVTQNAKNLSFAWARGEITGEQMKATLLASHKLMSTQTDVKR